MSGPSRATRTKFLLIQDVRDFGDASYIERDLALVTVCVEPGNRSEVIEIASLFRGKIVDVAQDSVIVELAGTEEKIDACVEMLRPYGIKELARTGVIAMARGMQSQKDKSEASSSGTVKRTRSLNAPAAQSLPPS